MQQPSGDHPSGAEEQEAEIPRQRCPEVVAHVVSLEEVVVDDPLDQVEDAPADE